MGENILHGEVRMGRIEVKGGIRREKEKKKREKLNNEETDA